MTTRPDARDGPRAVTQNPGGRRTTTSSPPGAEVIHRVSDESVNSRVCWRCGVPFAWTTDEDLARCTALAQAPGDDNPLHYTDAEVIEGWPGDDPAAALDWVHRRSAGEDGR